MKNNKLAKWGYVLTGVFAMLIIAVFTILTQPSQAEDGNVISVPIPESVGFEGSQGEVLIREFVENPEWTEKDAAEAKAALSQIEELGVSRDITIPAAGPETKGVYALLPIGGFVKLPPDAWIESSLMIEGCNLEDESQCVEGEWLTIIKRDGFEKEELWLVDGKIKEGRADNAKFQDLIPQITRKIEIEEGKGVPNDFMEVNVLNEK